MREPSITVLPLLSAAEPGAVLPALHAQRGEGGGCGHSVRGGACALRGWP